MRGLFIISPCEAVMFKVTFTRPSDSEPTVIFHARHDDALFTADQVRTVFRVAATVSVSEGEPWACTHRFPSHSRAVRRAISL
jgi:hypothetical protein